MEWSTSLIVTILIALVGWLGTLGGLIWYISGQFTQLKMSSNANGEDIGKVDNKLTRHIDAYDEHVTDSKVHTTEEQRRDINRRIDKLDDTVSNGLRDLGGKMDGVLLAILKK